MIDFQLLRKEILALPAAQRNVRNWTRDLRNGTSILGLVPPYGFGSSDMAFAVIESLAAQNLSYRVVGALIDSSSPLQATAAACDHDPESCRIGDIQALVDSHEREPLPTRIIWLTDLARCSKECQEAWFAFMKQWSHHQSGLPSDHEPLPAFLTVVESESVIAHIPASDTNFSVLRMSPSQRDVALLCETTDDCANSAERRWRRAVLPPLCTADIELVAQLWDKVLSPLEDILESLSDVAEQREWRHGGLDIHSNGAVDVVLNGRDAKPMHGQSCAWSKGIVCEADDKDWPEINSALLALHDDQSHRVMQRLWSGQLALVMPLINRLRIEFCRRLVARSGWPLPDEYIRAADEKDWTRVLDDPLSCELGHICQLLSNPDRFGLPMRWRPLFAMASYLRNELAHYRPIAFRQYEELEQMAAEFWNNSRAF